METKFKDWKINQFIARSPDGKYELWIKNGFWSFRDWECAESLLTGLPLWIRYKIWCELKKELKLRAGRFLA